MAHIIFNKHYLLLHKYTVNANTLQVKLEI
jgi:hypothetical protein